MRKNKGIWKYSKYLNPKVNKEFQQSIGEGGTACDVVYPIGSEQIRTAEQIYLKKEFENPNGSHKDRSLAFQISAHLQEGKTSFVISSSGNAAISAVAFCVNNGFSLTVFVSENLPGSKTQRLRDTLFVGTELDYDAPAGWCEIGHNNVHIKKVDNPKKRAIQFAKENDVVYLRGSIDPYAVEGFKTIAFELFEQAPDADSVFIPCSSGTSTVGIYEGYKQIQKEHTDFMIPQIHIIQTTKVHPIAEEFDDKFRETESSIAKAIVDRVAHRKKEVVDIIIATDGGGWVVDNWAIQAGERFLKENGIGCSEEGAMAIAGLKKARKNGFEFERPVCLLTGV